MTGLAEGPIRTCIGCRNRRSVVELRRLSWADGRLALDGRGGRGAWVCSATAGACLHSGQRRIGRALRHSVPAAALDAAVRLLAAEGSGVAHGSADRPPSFVEPTH